MSKVKTFLKKWIVNNLGFKILALALAFLLWLVITNTTDPNQTRTITGIPVQIENEELVLDGTHVYTVISGDPATVVVSGSRSIVGTLTAADFVATADFAELSITNAVPIKVELAGDKARYANAVNITQKTNSLVISLEDMSEESLEVDVQFNGQPSENLIIEDAVASPAIVVFHAPESMVTGAEKAVALVNYSEVTGDITLEKDLIVYNSDGAPIVLGEDVYLDQPRVSVRITTSSSKSVPVTIETSGVPAEGYELSGVSFSKNTVSVRGDEQVLSGITEIALPSDLLNIEGAEGDVSITVDLTPYLPEGVTLFGDTGTVTAIATIVQKETESTSEEEEKKEEETEETPEAESETEEEIEPDTDAASEDEIQAGPAEEPQADADTEIEIPAETQPDYEG